MMAGLRIEGDFSNISEPQLQFIRDILEKRGYNDNKVVFEPIGKVGDNYAADVKRIIVEENNGRTFKMVAKFAPNLEIARIQANTKILFQNEHMMYTKVLPKFNELQKQVGIPKEERLRYADCYGSYEEVPNEVILLEDLKEAKFEMMDRLVPLSDQCVKSVLKNFARLHSISYELKQKEPELLEDYKNSLFHIWSIIVNRKDVGSYFAQLETSVAMVLESDIHKKIINGIIHEGMVTLAKLVKDEQSSNSAIVLQGDSWTNNLMFRFDGENLMESIMIDYQLSTVGNPVCDILYMLFNCTDYKSRKQHFNEWIDYYHTELDKSLSIFGLKVKHLYPRDQLDDDLKRYGKANLGLSIILSSIVTLKPEEAIQLKKAMHSADDEEMADAANCERLGSETMEMLKSRVEGLIASSLELGFL